VFQCLSVVLKVLIGVLVWLQISNYRLFSVVTDVIKYSQFVWSATMDPGSFLLATVPVQNVPAEAYEFEDFNWRSVPGGCPLRCLPGNS